MTQAQALATELNDYTGDNYWQDVVLSEKYTIDSDRCDQGNGAIVFLGDGSKVMYDEREKTWTAYEAEGNDK